MAITIKEIHVHTTIEKKVVQTTDISEDVYRRIRDEVIRSVSGELFAQKQQVTKIKKNER